jgi:hypothetical protein
MGCGFSTSLVILGLHAFYWVLGGAFLGSVVGADQLEQQLYTCVEGVRRGGTLMLVEAPDNQAKSVSRILENEHGLLIYSLEKPANGVKRAAKA